MSAVLGLASNCLVWVRLVDAVSPLGSAAAGGRRVSAPTKSAKSTRIFLCHPLKCEATV